MNVSKLDAESRSAVDRLMENGINHQGGSNEALREQALRNLLELLNHYPVEDPSEELLDATLARVERHESDQNDRLRMSDAQEITPSSRWRFPDLIASAAALFLAVGIGWPVWQSIQNHRLQGTSEARLSSIGTAIAGFSGDNAGRLPLDHALLSENFDPIRHPHSHHLLNTLPNGEYLPRQQLFLSKDSSPDASASFSYRVPNADHSTFRIVLLDGRSPLAGDMNPVLWHLRSGEHQIEKLEGSPTHFGRGQVILQADLATRWDSVPIHHNDPIWTTQSCQESQIPLCTPSQRDDTLLAD